MKYLLLFSILLLAGCSKQPAEAPQLASVGSDYKQALETAKKEKKPILIVFHANWCGPCQRLNDGTLSNPLIKTELKKFVYLRIDIDDNRELYQKYAGSGIPAYVVIDKDEKALASGTGYRPVQDFLNWLKSVAQKLPVSNQAV